MCTAIHWFWCKPVPGSRTWKIGRAKSGSFYCQTWMGVQYSLIIMIVDWAGVQQDRQKFLELLEKRAKKRQKLLSMKRHSSLLKRPEILETVYRWTVIGGWQCWHLIGWQRGEWGGGHRRQQGGARGQGGAAAGEAIHFTGETEWIPTNGLTKVQSIYLFCRMCELPYLHCLL